MATSRRPEREDIIDRPYHHGQLRAALLAAAGDLLETVGAEGVSLRALARVVGVSQAAPYNHFESKEALLVAIAGEGFVALHRSQRKALDDLASGADALEALGLDYVLFATGQPQRYRLMFGVGLKDRCALAPVAAAKSASFEPVRATLAQRMSHSDPAAQDAAAVAAWAFVHGLASLLIDGSLHDPEFVTEPHASRTRHAIAAFARRIA